MSIAAALRRRPAAWRHRSFRRLSVAWFATNVGDSALYLSVAVWVKDLSGSDAAAAIVFAALGLATLTGPLMGHLVDTFARRRLMVTGNLIGAVVVASMLLVRGPEQIWLIYLVIFGYGTLGVLTGAAQSALLRDMLPDADLASGNGMLSTIDQALRLISPLIGTAMYVALGPHSVVLLTIACFLLTAVLLLAVKVAESPSEPSTESFSRQVWAGFRHVVATPVLGPLTLLVTIAFSATALLNVAAFPVIEQGLGLQTSALGVLVSVQGIGAVLGGASSATAIGRLGEVRTFSIGLALLALGTATMLTSSVVVVAGGMAVLGFGVTWTVVAFVTVRQKVTTPRMQGRTAAATMMSINAPQALLTLVGAGLVAVLDYRLLLVGTLLGVLGAMAAGFVLGRAPLPTPPAAGIEPVA
ncbi:MFS transporter [Pseudactinotalea suaedae]|uniref:MFS transporter n=1 Tax=Pseudactinotalea suaedae TaxID=1524924 RepID=UPI0012E318BB|nr:MFS transporter [Pseudactinotalea suaedae]